MFPGQQNNLYHGKRPNNHSGTDFVSSSCLASGGMNIRIPPEAVSPSGFLSSANRPAGAGEFFSHPPSTAPYQLQSAVPFAFNTATSTTSCRPLHHPTGYQKEIPCHAYAALRNGHNTLTGPVQFPSPVFTSPPTLSSGVPLQQDGGSPNTTWARSTPAEVSFGDSASFSSGHYCGENSKASGTKRKSLQGREEADECHSRKVYISEEKMAARLQGLHLDNNNADWHPDLEDSWLRRERRTLKQIEDSLEIEEDSNDSEGEVSQAPRIQLSEEVKDTIMAGGLLRKVVMDELKKPNLQVVLWQPPCGFIKEQLTPSSEVPVQALSSSSDVTQGEESIDIDSQEPPHLASPGLLASPLTCSLPNSSNQDDIDLDDIMDL